MRARLPLLAAALLWACRADPEPDPAARARVDALLAHRFAEGPLHLKRFDDRAHRLPTHTVTPVQFLLRPGFVVVGALFEPVEPTGAGVVVAHGHFGQAKGAPETQEIAHRLAARGAVVLAVDTPGTEEWAAPRHHLHFDEGAHGRGYLAAGGSSALSLQVQLLQRGLDVLASLGAERFAATGASGGAVQSLYLLLADPRVTTAVMASFPPLPREARAGGCACDQVPGWPGPDAALLTLIDRPTLWLADGHDNRPPGLPTSGRFVRFESPHSYDRAMQDAALDWLGEQLDLDQGDLAPPLLDLSTPGPQPGGPGQDILGLPLPGGAPWEPVVVVGSSRLSVELDCRGDGPVVLAAGVEDAGVEALVVGGMKACVARVTPDEIGVAEGIGTGEPYAGRLGLALQEAARMAGARVVVAARGWATPAAASGLPYAVVDPLRGIGDLDLERDAPWVHTPGAWWGGLGAIHGAALAAGAETAVVRAVREHLDTTPKRDP